MKVAIGIPCHVFISPQTAQSLAQMCGSLGRAGIEHDVRLLGNASLAFGRNALAAWAIKQEASHLLFIDTDLMFPADGAERLLAHGRALVGANYARKNEARDSACFGIDGERIRPKADGLEEARTLGMGFALIRRDVLEAVRFPWFTLKSDARGGPAEDFLFCQAARVAGFPAFVDHALSRDCAHIGLHAYTLPEA